MYDFRFEKGKKGLSFWSSFPQTPLTNTKGNFYYVCNRLDLPDLQDSFVPVFGANPSADQPVQKFTALDVNGKVVIHSGGGSY